MEENSNNNKTPSQFYFACRNNDVETVRRLLDEYPLETLDKVEPNDSTALHAACFYKNAEIVKLLLDKGFSRRVINKYKYTPCEESNSEEIKLLFRRPTTSNRFGGDISYEDEKRSWIIIDGTEQHVVPNRRPDTYRGNRLEYGTFHGDKLIEQLDKRMPKIGAVRRLIHRAMNEKDCTRLIQAYTTDTKLANLVNDYLIMQQVQNEKDDNDSEYVMSEFIDTIYFNRHLHDKYQFQGKCYRSLKIRTGNDLNIYKIGKKLINQTFISATKDRALAEAYVRDRNEEKKYAVILSFDIRQSNTALDIESLSEFSDEKEILIMSNKIFKVLSVKKRTDFDADIELRESKSMHVDQKGKQSTVSELLNWK